MSENLVAYLRQRSEPVSAAELAGQVLRMPAIPAAAAQRIVSALLEGEPRVARIGEEAWIYCHTSAPQALDHLWLIFTALPERARHWSRWHAAACLRVEGGSTQLVSRITAAEEPEWPAALRALLQLVMTESGAAAVVLTGYGDQIALFRQAAADLLGAAFTAPLFSMRRVAGALFPDGRVSDAGQLAALLGQPALVEADIGAASEHAAEMWLHLLARLEERDICDAAALTRLLETEVVETDLSGYAFDAEFLHSLPAQPGVYLMRDREGVVIYVGKAKNLAQRVRSYFAAESGLDAKLQTLRARLYELEIVLLGSELEALLLEQRLIRDLDPEVNRQIAVQARPHRRKSRYPRILLLPAAEPEWLRLFFIDPEQGLAHYWLPRALADARRDSRSPLALSGAPGEPVLPRALAGIPEDPRMTRAQAGLPEDPRPPQAAEFGRLLHDEAGLAEALQRYFFDRSSSGDPDAAEIAWSWLGEQREVVHGIDMRAVTTAAEAMRLLRLYRVTEWTEKVIYR